MANYVNFSINFISINSEAKQLLDELFTRIRKDGEHSWFYDIFVDGENLTYEDASQYSWSYENIGPKWSYLDDWSEDSIFGTSAWSAPDAGLKKLVNLLYEVDPNLSISMSYEDEVPLLAGFQVYSGNKLIASNHWDEDEIRVLVTEELDELSMDDWSEDDFEWIDESKEDIFQNNVSEIISETIESKIEVINKNLSSNELQAFAFCFSSYDFIEVMDDDGLDKAKSFLIENYFLKIMEGILVNVDPKARFFWNKSSHEPLEIKNNSESINNILNFSSKEEAEQFAESDYLNFIAIVTGNHHWSDGFLKSSNDIYFTVIGMYPAAGELCLQGYDYGDFDTGIVVSPNERGYEADNHLEVYSLSKNDLNINSYKL